MANQGLVSYGFPILKISKKILENRRAICASLGSGVNPQGFFVGSSWICLRWFLDRILSHGMKITIFQPHHLGSIFLWKSLFFRHLKLCKSKPCNFYWLRIGLSFSFNQPGAPNSGAAFEKAQGDGLPTNRRTESTPRMRGEMQRSRVPSLPCWLFWRSVKSWWMFCLGRQRWQNVTIHQSERSNFNYTLVLQIPC